MLRDAAFPVGRRPLDPGLLGPQRRPRRAAVPRRRSIRAGRRWRALVDDEPIRAGRGVASTPPAAAAGATRSTATRPWSPPTSARARCRSRAPRDDYGVVLADGAVDGRRPRRCARRCGPNAARPPFFDRGPATRALGRPRLRRGGRPRRVTRPDPLRRRGSGPRGGGTRRRTGEHAPCGGGCRLTSRPPAGQPVCCVGNGALVKTPRRSKSYTRLLTWSPSTAPMKAVSLPLVMPRL